MFGRSKDQGTAPGPGSLEIHDVALRDFDEKTYTPQTGLPTTREPIAPQMGPTPYLGLRARLSQVWLNRWTVLLLLILVRVMLRLGDLNVELADAKVKALSACTKVEDIGSTMASMPHYLSVGVNDLIKDGVNKAVAGMVDILMMILTGVEELILFVINMYVGMYACLISAFIHGSLDVAVAVVEDADKWFNSNIGNIANDLQNAVNGVNSAIETLYGDYSAATSDIGKGVSDVTSFAGGILGNLKVRATEGLDAISIATVTDGAAVSHVTPAAIVGHREVTSAVTESIPRVTEVAIETIMSAAATVTASPSHTLAARGGAPTLDLTSFLNNLKNLHVNDTQFVGDLVSLNTTIPTFAQAENMTREAISIPFDFVKKALNDSYAGWTFDDSTLPVADKQSLSFCSGNSMLEDFFTELFTILIKAKYVAIALLVLLAVLSCIFWAMMDVRRWNKEKRRAREFSRRAYDGMDIVYIASRPFTAWIGIKLSSRFKGRPQVLVRWAVAYATSLPALFILSLALAGLFSCACQAIILWALQKEAPALAAEVAHFADDVISTLEDVSVKWANDANNHTLHTQNIINNDVLNLVQNATSAVNNTLNTVENAINGVLTAAFNGTVLYNTIMDVVYCLVESKIDEVEKGLTWVHDNAHVTLPLLPNDTFSQGAAASIGNDTGLTSFLASPSTVTTDDIDSAVDYVLNALHNGLVQEFLISIALLLIYVIVVLGGVLYAALHAATPDRSGGNTNTSAFVNPAGMTMEDNADPFADPPPSPRQMSQAVPKTVSSTRVFTDRKEKLSHD